MALVKDERPCPLSKEAKGPPMKRILPTALIALAASASVSPSAPVQHPVARQVGDVGAESAAQDRHQHRVKFVFFRNGIQGILKLEGRGIWRETSADGYDENWIQVFDCDEYIEMEFVTNRALKYRVYNDHIDYKGHGRDGYVRDGEGWWAQ
jgi:hypothetical protein